MTKDHPSGMGRRSFIGALAGGAATWQLAAAPSPKRRRPNVIYAFSDEHRYQSMAFSEMPELETPHMARLAAQGFGRPAQDGVLLLGARRRKDARGFFRSLGQARDERGQVICHGP